tara:strand:+ start:194 stop:454 length:261 start_codon:yes stop_codon:yes gene_type:complete
MAFGGLKPPYKSRVVVLIDDDRVRHWVGVLLDDGLILTRVRDAGFHYNKFVNAKRIPGFYVVRVRKVSRSDEGQKAERYLRTINGN